MSVPLGRIDAAIGAIADALAAAPIDTQAIGLGSPVAGEALALLASGLYLDDDRIRSAARHRIAKIWEHDKGLRGAPVSLFDGRAGLGLLACHALEDAPEDPETLLALDRALRSVAQRLLHAPWTGHFDHVSGLSGLSVFLCEPRVFASRMGGNPLCLRLAEELWRHSARTDRGTAWCEPFSSPEDEYGSGQKIRYVVNMGLAHGSPGAVLALTRLARRCAFSPRQIERLKDAVRFLLSHRGEFSDSGLSSSFPCMTALSHAWEVPSRLAWCYGDLGIIYTALAAAPLTGTEDETRNIASQVLRACSARPIGETGINDGGLCHGDASILAMALGIRSLCPEVDVAPLIERHAERLLTLVEGELDPDGLPSVGSGWKTFRSTDLLTGSGGVLLTLLALRDPRYLRFLNVMGLDLDARAQVPPQPERDGPQPFLGIRVCLRSPVRDLTGTGRRSSPNSLERHAADLLRDDAVALSMFIARPQFFTRVLQRLDDDEHLADDVVATLFRFFHRMCFRPTPYGAFAAVGAPVTLSHEDAVALPDCRLDVDLDCGYLAYVATGATGKRSARLRCNPSVWWDQGVLHWMTTGDLDGPWNYEQIVAAVEPALADFVLGAEAAPPADLEAAFRNLSVSRAATISELHRAEVLIPEADPILLGHDATDRTLDRLQDTVGNASLSGLRQDLEAARRDPCLTSLEQLRTTAETFAPGWNGDILHVDAHCDGPVEVPKAAVPALSSAWSLLEKVGYRTPRPARLDAFERRFLDRYGDRAVLIAQAVDAEAGLAYLGMPLRMDFVSGADASVDAPANTSGAFPIETDWEARRWRLSPKEIENLHDFNTRQDLRDISGGVLLSRVGCTSGQDRTWTAYPEGIFPGGPKAIFGRFSRRNRAIEEALMRHDPPRADDATIVEADVLCATDPRSSNILRRAELSPYVIEILGDSGLPSDRKIPLHDLWIRHDGSRFRLFSASRGVEVIPKLHAAHQSPPGAPAVYLLLIDISTHMRQPTVIWSWQSQSGRNRLPRVTAGNVVLAPERWRLNLPADLTTPREAEDWLETTRRRLSLPRYIAPTEEASDMATPWDLDNPVSSAGLIKALKKKAPLSVCEYLPAPADWWIRSADGPVAAELVYAPAPRSDIGEVDYEASPSVWQPVGVGADESGSWLYLRLFGDAMKLERYLKRQSQSLALWQRGKLIENWFYVRYASPDLELRIRLKFRDDRDHVVRNRVLFRMRKAAEELVERVMVDDYLPETARYGGDAGLHACEGIFGADSVAALQILDDPSIGRSRRWMAAAASIDALFEDLELPTGVRLAISERCAETYGGDPASRRTARRATVAKWKEARAVLRTLGVGKDIESRPAHWNIRAASHHSGLRHLQRAEQDGRLGTSLADILGSLAHMSVNRILHWGSVAEEAVIHEALCRHYRTVLNRAPEPVGAAAPPMGG